MTFNKEVQSLADDVNSIKDTVESLSHALEVVEELAPTAPPLPPGRNVEIPDRGTTFIREIKGPVGAKTLLLLHGWTATADLNWFTSYEQLGQHFNVVALDHRGHGRGIRSNDEFKLEQCAQDAVALADVLGISTFIPVGYSMGGAIAQIIANNYTDRVDALVLSSTASIFSSTRAERLSFLGLSGLAVLAKFTPAQARSWITEQVYLNRKTDAWHPWAIEEVSRHDWKAILEAGREIGDFNSSTWLSELDIPTSVIITMADDVVPTRRQIQLFKTLNNAEAYRVDGDHDAVVENAKTYVPTLVRACHSAISRI